MTNSQITKPMLAGKAPEDLADLNFPVIASPKLDGFRVMIIDGRARSPVSLGFRDPITDV